MDANDECDDEASAEKDRQELLASKDVVSTALANLESGNAMSGQLDTFKQIKELGPELEVKKSRLILAVKNDINFNCNRQMVEATMGIAAANEIEDLNKTVAVLQGQLEYVMQYNLALCGNITASAEEMQRLHVVHRP